MESGKIEFINATQMDQAIADTGKELGEARVEADSRRDRQAVQG